jgi:hypothetical protein
MITVNCPKEDCDGDEAYFYQLQIRSADEPMTSFFKVRYRPCIEKRSTDLECSARNVRSNGGNETTPSPKICYATISALKSYDDFE